MLSVIFLAAQSRSREIGPGAFRPSNEEFVARGFPAVDTSGHPLVANNHLGRPQCASALELIGMERRLRAVEVRENLLLRQVHDLRATISEVKREVAYVRYEQQIGNFVPTPMGAKMASMVNPRGAASTSGSTSAAVNGAAGEFGATAPPNLQTFPERSVAEQDEVSLYDVVYTQREHS